VLKKWQTKVDTNEDEICRWAKLYPYSDNSGLLTINTPGLDLDILIEPAARAAEELVKDRYEELGNCPVRIGLPPKRAMLFRTDEPFEKITVNLIGPTGKDEKVEFLGTGQQIACFGIHPDTKQPYLWYGGEPGKIPRKDLPYIREDEAQKLVDDIVDLLIREHGYRRKTEAKAKGNGNGKDRDGNRGNFNWNKLGNILDHDDLCSAALAFIIGGLDKNTTYNLLRSRVEAIETKQLDRKHRRLDELRGIVDSAYAKAGKNGVEQIDCEPWWVDPKTIPPRAFLYEKHYARKCIGASIGAGGRMKTSEGLLEAVEMALRRNLCTREPLPTGLLRVLCLNAEEDQDELDRRVAAICQRYNITKEELGNRLFVKSVRNRPLRLATMVNSSVAALNKTALAALENFIASKRVDVFMLDPWVSFHAVRESDNADMDLLIKHGLGGIAERTNSAGEIFHHPGKPKLGQDTVVEDARGASAIIWAVRSARVFNFMTSIEATKLGIPERDRRRYIRITNGKANYGPLDKADWIKIEVENLPNGDAVACGSPWKPLDPFAGVSSADMHKCRELTRTAAYRLDSRSEDWIGYAVADILKVNVVHGAENDPKDIARIKQVLAAWFKNKVLATEKRKDKTRHEKTFVIPGPWNDPPEMPAPDDIDDITIN
jgi:hypothetical protein